MKYGSKKKERVKEDQVKGTTILNSFTVEVSTHFITLRVEFSNPGTTDILDC